MTIVSNEEFCSNLVSFEEIAIDDFQESINREAPTKYYEWIDGINNDVVRIPLFGLTVTEEGTCKVKYSINTFKRDVMTRIDLSFYSGTGFQLLTNLSLEPQRYAGPGAWDWQIKVRNWFEVRQDFSRIRSAGFRFYTESSFD